MATARAPMPPQRATTWDRRSIGNAAEKEPERRWQQGRRADPLDQPSGDEQRHRGCQPAQRRAEAEHARPAKNTRRLPTRSAVRPAMTSNEPNTMLYPVITQARAARGVVGEGALERREGHVHDREVEGGHERPQCRDDEHHLAPSMRCSGEAVHASEFASCNVAYGLRSMMQPTILEAWNARASPAWTARSPSASRWSASGGACWSCATPSWGVTRFDDFQRRLGISRNILQQRLTNLVEVGRPRAGPLQRAPAARTTTGSPTRAETSGRCSRPCASGAIATPLPTGLPSR